MDIGGSGERDFRIRILNGRTAPQQADWCYYRMGIQKGGMFGGVAGLPLLLRTRTDGRKRG